MTSILALAEQKAGLDSDPQVIEAMKVISTIDQFKVLVIKSDDQERQYTEMLIQAKQVDKALDGRRTELVDPHNRLVKSINGYFKALVVPVKSKMGEIENAIKRWRYQKMEEERKAQERAARESQRIQERMEKKGIDAPPPVIIAPKRETITRAESGSAYEKKSWQVEVNDIRALAKAVAEGQVNDSVLKPDMTALRGLVRAGIRNIPGCRVYEDVSIETRGM